MGRPVKVLDITDDEQTGLKRWLLSRQIPAAEQQRTRIILPGTEGLSGKVMGERVGLAARESPPCLRETDQHPENLPALRSLGFSMHSIVIHLIRYPLWATGWF